MILQRLKAKLAAGEAFDGGLLSVIGDWLDRTARLSKVVLDVRIDERRVQLEGAQARIVGMAMNRALEASVLTREQRTAFTQVFIQELRAGERGPAGAAMVRGEVR